MIEHRMPIPSRAYNAAVGGHVCGPEDIDFGQKVVHLIKYDKDGNEVSFESQVTQTNKIYVIHDDFTLSSNVTVPANCVLQFEGGSLNGAYTITGTNTVISAPLVKIFGTNLTFAGTWNSNGHVRWFGAKPENADNVTYIQKAIDSFRVVEFDACIYKTSPLNMTKADTLIGSPLRVEGAWISFILNDNETGLTFTSQGGGYYLIKYITFYADGAPSSSEEIPYKANTTGLDGQNAALNMEYCTIRSFEIGIKGGTNSWSNRFVNCRFSFLKKAIDRIKTNYLVVDRCDINKVENFLVCAGQDYIVDRPNVQNCVGIVTILNSCFENNKGVLFLALKHEYCTLIINNNYFENYTGRIISGNFKHIRDVNNLYYMGGTMDRLAMLYRPLSIISEGNKIYINQNATTKPLKSIYECVPSYETDIQDTDMLKTVRIDGNNIAFENSFAINPASISLAVSQYTNLEGVIFASGSVYELNMYTDFRRVGNTANRPIYNQYVNGKEYIDTDLGKPIYWIVSVAHPNGAWVDATGATV